MPHNPYPSAMRAENLNIFSEPLYSACTPGTGSPTHRSESQKNALFSHRYLSSPESDYFHPGTEYLQNVPQDQTPGIS